MNDKHEVERPRARWQLAIVVTVLFVAMLFYRVLHAGSLEQTALLYVGLPAFIAVAIVLWVRPKNPIGVGLAVVTVGLVLSAPLLGEGMACLIVAAPICWLVVTVVGTVINAKDKRSGEERHRAVFVAPLMGLLLVPALEGTGAYDLPRSSSAVAQVVTEIDDTAFEAALASSPTFTEPESVFLRLPFPRPVAVTGVGLRTGSRREIAFTNGRSMRLVVTEREPGRVTFDVESDAVLSKWLDFETAAVTWRSTGDELTITWTMQYQRTFDPGWYFGPVQEYGMERAAEYLAQTFADSAK